MSKSRNIIATTVRKREIIRERRYVRVDTAIRRTSQLVVLEAQPGDAIFFTHAVTGLEIGEIHVGKNSFTARWIWD